LALVLFSVTFYPVPFAIRLPQPLTSKHYCLPSHWPNLQAFLASWFQCLSCLYS